MVDRVVSVRVEAKVEGAVAGFRKVKASVDDLTKAATPKSGDAFKKLSDSAALAGVGIAGAMVLATKRFAEFDKSMSAVKANSGATAAELEGLRGLAVRLGADSQFSAKEAADGINEMAKAGVNVKDVMGGGLKGALDLAAAGQIGVAQAAETAATAMTQFKLKGDSVPHIADLLANAANKAQGGVGDMAQALQQAGLVAASTGLSIEETTAGLTAFASAGLIGSDAGTSFKTMLQRLSAPVGEAAKTLDEFGISAYDSQGNFVGLADVAGQLQTKFKDLTPEVRNQALAVIFGSDAIRAANVLYEQGAAGIDKWTEAVNEQGAAAKQAATLTDNLRGDLERLGGALDTAFIQGGSSANGGLRTLVQGVTELVDAVGKIPGPILLAGGALASFALLAPKGILKYRDYKTQLDSVGLSLDKITTKAPRTGRALEAAATAAKAYAAALAVLQVTTALADNGEYAPSADVATRLGKASDAVREYDAAIKSASNNKFAADDDIQNFSTAVQNAFNPNALRFFQNQVASLFGDTIPTTVKQGEEAIRQLDAALSAVATSEGPKVAKEKFDQFAAAAEKQGVSVEKFKSKLPQYSSAMASMAAESKSTSSAVGNLGKVTGDAATALGFVAADGDSAASAMLLFGKNAEGAKDAVDALAKKIQGDMDAAASAFARDTDVLGKYDPEAAADAAKAAADRVAEAEQSAQDTRERIAAKKKKTVSDDQALRRAAESVDAARTAKQAADARVGQAGLTAMYAETLQKARKFTSDIAAATRLGLDPQAVAKLLQEGPEKAAPALEALVGKNSANLIKMVNSSEEALRQINASVVEQSRLTSMAINAPTDALAGDLDVAMGIAQVKAAQGGSATAAEIAKQLRAGKPEIERIAAEFGIALRIPPPRPTKLQVDSKEALAAIRDARQELANLDGMTAHTAIEVRIANIRDARQDAANSNTAGTLIPEFDPKVHRAQGGIIPGFSPTATSDNIIAAVTAGEYVIRKASVDQLGKATLDYLNRYGRMPRYASGGVVEAGQRARSVPMMLAPSRAGDSLARQFVSGSLDMGNGLTGFVRAIVADQIAGTTRREGMVTL